MIKILKRNMEIIQEIYHRDAFPCFSVKFLICIQVLYKISPSWYHYHYGHLTFR